MGFEFNALEIRTGEFRKSFHNFQNTWTSFIVFAPNRTSSSRFRQVQLLRHLRGGRLPHGLHPGEHADDVHRAVGGVRPRSGSQHEGLPGVRQLHRGLLQFAPVGLPGRHQGQEGGADRESDGGVRGFVSVESLDERLGARPVQIHQWILVSCSMFFSLLWNVHEINFFITLRLSSTQFAVVSCFFQSLFTQISLKAFSPRSRTSLKSRVRRPQSTTWYQSFWS